MKKENSLTVRRFRVTLPFSAGSLIRGFGRLFSRRTGSPGRDTWVGYRAGAERTISEYHDKNAAVFERAQRLIERAKRLEGAGMPSESASNRAARAREDALEALSELRNSFSAGIPEKARIFDEEARRFYPFLELPGCGS